MTSLNVVYALNIKTYQTDSVKKTPLLNTINQDLNKVFDTIKGITIEPIFDPTTNTYTYILKKNPTDTQNTQKVIIYNQSVNEVAKPGTIGTFSKLDEGLDYLKKHTPKNKKNLAIIFPDGDIHSYKVASRLQKKSLQRRFTIVSFLALEDYAELSHTLDQLLNTVDMIYILRN